MNIDIAVPDDRARMISEIGNMIQSSLDERSIAQHAEMILDEYIVRTNHHIWLVGQCAKILRDIIISHGQDIEMFDTNVEFHDYDKTHNDEILPVYALACHYFYFHNKDVKYKVDEDWLDHEFEHNAWPKHHKANKHHYAEHYGKKNDKGVLEVPETYDILNLVEMYADWMAMGITNGGTAHDWWTKNYGPDNKFDFHGRDLGVIQECILAEDKAVNQLAYLRQFKDVEPTWVPPMEIETHDEVDPLTTKEVNEGIENFFNYESNETLSLKRDDLYIGPIDPMIIDPEKMMKLAEYPELLLALKKWTTMPDFNLAPQLTMLGKIVDDLYKFKNPITCYRGIRTGFDSRSNKKQNLMGVIDNDIAYLRLLKPGFDKAGTTFEYETQEPMSVARSPYIAKIYGNFIIKTEVPADANKLVITPELSYLLQQMEVEYPEYRAVNLSITHEVVVFSGTKLTFEIVSVFGDISSELETMKEHSFEGLGNTEMNGVYFNIDKSFEVHEYNTKDDEDAPESHFDWSDFFGELAAAFKGRRPYTGIFEDLYKTQSGTVAFKQALQRVINMYTGALKQDPNKMLTNTCLWIANRSGDKVSGIPEAKKAAITLGESIFPKFDESILYFKRGTVTLATAGVKERIVLFRNRRNTIAKLFDKIKTQSTDVIKLYQNAKNNTVSSSIEKSYIEAAKSILDIRTNQLKEQLVQFEKITKQIIDEYDKEIETLKKQLKEFAESEESIESDDSNDISTEALLAFKNTGVDKQITDLARPCYKPTGQNSWEHIQQVYSQASRICRKIYNRDLTRAEYAAILFHDCSVIDSGKENHNVLSAEKAIKMLSHTPFTDIERDQIYNAIIEHDNQDTDGQWSFSSPVSELVAAGDFNPPDAEWIMNKSYTWGITHGLDHAGRIENMVSLIKRAYSTNGEMWLHMPNAYKKYFATKISAVKKLFDKITPEEAEKIVMAYRKKHHLSETDTNLPTSSVEALSPDIKKKKQLIIDYICSVCDIMDPSKLNSKRYHRLLDSMSDKEFDQWMHYVKEGKWKIHIVAPNLVVTLKNENSLKAADKVKCKLFHRLWMTDDSTGRQYLTDNEYLVLNLPVRRQQQFLDEKMSVPDNDKQIDGLTGQVTGDSKSSAVTNPEIQILAARGLDATLEEFVNVRGGNIAAYSDFKRQAEETGEIKLNSLDQNTRSRVAVVGQVLLRSMMIENNIVE